MRPSLLALVLPIVVACGASRPAEPVKAPPAEKEAAPAPGEKTADAPAPSAVAKIPTECASSGDICTLPHDFVSRLCQDVYPNVALVLFEKGTPWTRGYLTRKTEAWNTDGASVRGFVEFDEEVLLLSAQVAPKGGMQMSGMGGYQALRWDGSCVTLQTEEVTTRKPPSPKHPRIDWRRFDDAIRDTLRKDPTVNDAFLAQRRECKGVSSGDVSKKCIENDGKLVESTVKFVEETGGLPDPEKVP